MNHFLPKATRKSSKTKRRHLKISNNYFKEVFIYFIRTIPSLQQIFYDRFPPLLVRSLTDALCAVLLTSQNNVTLGSGATGQQQLDSPAFMLMMLPVLDRRPFVDTNERIKFSNGGKGFHFNICIFLEGGKRLPVVVCKGCVDILHGCLPSLGSPNSNVLNKCLNIFILFLKKNAFSPFFPCYHPVCQSMCSCCCTTVGIKVDPNSS